MAAVSAPSLVPSAEGQPDLRRLRLAYVASVAVLIVLALATLASPIVLPSLRRERAALPETSRLQVLARAGEWVLQYDLLNAAPDAAVYAFELTTPSASGSPSSPLHASSVPIGPGRPYVFINHVRPDQVTDGVVRFTVRRGAEPTPLEDVTLHLRPAGDHR